MMRCAALLLLLAQASVAAPVYLRCPMETGGRLDFVLDAEGGTITHIFAGQKTEPLQIKTTDTSFVHEFVFKETLMQRISINRFTLQISYFNSFPPARTVDGQCAQVERQL